VREQRHGRFVNYEVDEVDPEGLMHIAEWLAKTGAKKSPKDSCYSALQPRLEAVFDINSCTECFFVIVDVVDSVVVCFKLIG